MKTRTLPIILSLAGIGIFVLGVVFLFSLMKPQPSLPNKEEILKRDAPQPSMVTHIQDRVIPIEDTKSLRVPIVLYHHIRPITPTMDELAKGLSVTPEVFDRQLAYLAKNGFHTITLHQLILALEGTEQLPEKPIILTFDDGYRDTFTYAYPLLVKRHFSGSLFIFTQAIGAPDYLTWDQVQQMQQSGIFEIGSHTLSHADLPTLSEKDMMREIRESKKIIASKLGAEIDFFCYPYGHYTKKIAEEVKKAGYLGALTTRYGTVHAKESLYETSRVRLTNDDYGPRLEKKIGLFFR